MEEGLNTFSLAGTADIQETRNTNPEALQSTEMRIADTLSDFLLDTKERRASLPETTFDKVAKNNLLIVETMHQQTDNKQLMYDSKPNIPLTYDNASPWIRQDGDTMVPATRGETNAVQLVGIKMRKGDTAECVDAQGNEITVALTTLRRAQGIIALDVAKAEAGTLTAEENAQANEQLLDNGFIPVDSAVASLTKDKQAVPATPPDGADAAEVEEYNKEKAAAEKHNEPIDKLIGSLSTHGVLTESDFKMLVAHHGSESMPRIQESIHQIDQDIQQKRELLAKLNGQGDTGLTNEIAELQQQKAALEATVKNYNDPEKIEALYAQTRSPEIARQVNQFLAEGDINKAMDTMIESQLLKLKEGDEREAARKRLEALKKRGEQLAAAVGGGAALIIYLLFVEGIKQQ